MRKLVRLARAAECLGVRTPTLRDWYMKRKNLDFVKAGRAVCVTEESIERFIAENTRFRLPSPGQVKSQSSPEEPTTPLGLGAEVRTQRCRAQRATLGVLREQA